MRGGADLDTDGVSGANMFLNQRNMPNCTRLQTLCSNSACRHLTVQFSTGGSTWSLPAKLGATLLTAATVARTLMLNPSASQSQLSEFVSRLTHIKAVIGAATKENSNCSVTRKPPRILHALPDPDHETSSQFLRARAQTCCTV